MPFNLDTYDETGRDFNQHDLSTTDQSYVLTVEIISSDAITDAVVRDRLTKFVHNLGDNATVVIDHHTNVHQHLDNLDF